MRLPRQTNFCQKGCRNNFRSGQCFGRCQLISHNGQLTPVALHIRVRYHFIQEQAAGIHNIPIPVEYEHRLRTSDHGNIDLFNEFLIHFLEGSLVAGDGCADILHQYGIYSSPFADAGDILHFKAVKTIGQIQVARLAVCLGIGQVIIDHLRDDQRIQRAGYQRHQRQRRTQYIQKPPAQQPCANSFHTQSSLLEPTLTLSRGERGLRTPTLE